jgi:hypothetical protein
MEVKKIITMNSEEIKKILTKFVEKKIKSTVVNVFESNDGSLEFHVTPTAFDETGE